MTTGHKTWDPDDPEYVNYGPEAPTPAEGAEQCPTCGNAKNDPKSVQVGLNAYKECTDEFHEYKTMPDVPEPE